ncbi:ketosteroid isomerase [Streptomyces palmae]|uniref:Ketosteroid isomerase n=2 Tax=Streptomyces palmae TaxID=1701085 RepID=A0A4Z0FS70_9ACTN|nr:ketosteroid isomerase [Streptomyces palmae]
MDALIRAHVAAEMNGDPAGCVAVYTDDVEHDVVGFPLGPQHGRQAALAVYERLTQDIRTEEMDPRRTYYGDDSCVMEHQWTGTVPGDFLGIPGNGRRISFRMLHVFEFRDGLISRENVWIDGAAVTAQLA